MLQLGQHCSMTERRADEATRDVADWLKCDFMQDQVGNVFNNHYIEKAWNPTIASKDVVPVNPDDVYLFYAIGRTGCVKLKIDF